jgi:tartrate dehydratase beta subunit/fumarate hydratase class I family protein
MDKATLDAMKECGCIYLAVVDGCSAVYARGVELTAEYWPELTPTGNQRLEFHMQDFGPLFPAMDAHGNSIYEKCAQFTREKLPSIYAKLGIETLSKGGIKS